MNSHLQSILLSGAVNAAPALVGWGFYKIGPGREVVGGTILETEAYTQDDAASHSFSGRTARNDYMFHEAGILYVYFTYGMHWCANIVTGTTGTGEAVLIRAIRPEHGLALMRSRRPGKSVSNLCSGPAKLCQALGITKEYNGESLYGSRILMKPPAGEVINIVATPRIGIKKDSHRLWRFVSV
jgi:DNA-3-methyladenine glycosylase